MVPTPRAQGVRRSLTKPPRGTRRALRPATCGQPEARASEPPALPTPSAAQTSSLPGRAGSAAAAWAVGPLTSPLSPYKRGCLRGLPALRRGHAEQLMAGRDLRQGPMAPSPAVRLRAAPSLPLALEGRGARLGDDSDAGPAARRALRTSEDKVHRRTRCGERDAPAGRGGQVRAGRADRAAVLPAPVVVGQRLRPPRRSSSRSDQDAGGSRTRRPHPPPHQTGRSGAASPWVGQALASPGGRRGHLPRPGPGSVRSGRRRARPWPAAGWGLRVTGPASDSRTGQGPWGLPTSGDCSGPASSPHSRANGGDSDASF